MFGAVGLVNVTVDGPRDGEPSLRLAIAQVGARLACQHRLRTFATARLRFTQPVRKAALNPYWGELGYRGRAQNRQPLHL